MERNSFSVFTVFCCVSLVFGAVTYGGITIEGTKCGQKVCKLSEYCSNFDSTCQQCSSVCDAKGHNYEKQLCESQCQDYLHDLRYVSKTGGDNGDLRVTVQELSRMVTVTLTLVILMLIVLFGVLVFQLYRWKVKKDITWDSIKNKFFKKRNSENINTTPSQDNKKKDLRLEIPSPTLGSEHSPVTVTTSIDRRPAEDSTLDYAYDNPAMTKSHNSSF
ncbi:protein grindelwald [Sitophilus oryzae]|uniref:Protein grindelwald n=1 Tax=Sitophilus oryzae TaxID=7048 RepID=A0A6J2XSD8_SITOR|nr:protein grindelwald [Sitophilus oryzae]